VQYESYQSYGQEGEGEQTLLFEYNASATLFEELTRLSLFQSLPLSEKTSLRSGQWSQISCRKLEVRLCAVCPSLLIPPSASPPSEGLTNVS
jgi:hypothetical protein